MRCLASPRVRLGKVIRDRSTQSFCRRKQSKQASKQASTGRTSRALSVTLNGALYWLPIHHGPSSLGDVWPSDSLRRQAFRLGCQCFSLSHISQAASPRRSRPWHHPNCIAASQSKPPRLSNGSPMSAHSLSLCLSTASGRMCVRMCVRPCMCALPASPPHPPHHRIRRTHSCICCVELPAARRPILSSTSASSAARPPPVACTCQTHLLIRLVVRFRPSFCFPHSPSGLSQSLALPLYPSLPPSPVACSHPLFLSQTSANVTAEAWGKFDFRLRPDPASSATLVVYRPLLPCGSPPSGFT